MVPLTLCLLFVWLLPAINGQNPEMIVVDNGLNEGSWGPAQFCPNNTYAGLFEYKYESLDHVDNTAGNAIKLYCLRSDGSVAAYITSTEGRYGEWQGLRSCTSGYFLSGFTLEVIGFDGSLGDSLGVNNIQMNCTNGLILEGLTAKIAMHFSNCYKRNAGSSNSTERISPSFQTNQDRRSEERRPNMDELREKIYLRKPKNLIDSVSSNGWGSWARCSSGRVICGLQTRVDVSMARPVGDDSGLTDVVMYCCQKP